MSKTPAEQCKADVEAWWREWDEITVEEALKRLIARQTPVYERAQLALFLTTDDATKAANEMRERAERAEADVVSLRRQIERAEELHREDREDYVAAEADVARLREALTILRIGATGHDRIGIDEALAATERR